MYNAAHCMAVAANLILPRLGNMADGELRGALQHVYEVLRKTALASDVQALALPDGSWSIDQQAATLEVAGLYIDMARELTGTDRDMLTLAREIVMLALADIPK